MPRAHSCVTRWYARLTSARNSAPRRPALSPSTLAAFGSAAKTFSFVLALAMMSGCVQSGDLLAEWERRFVADPAKANRDLLVEALALFEREIANELSAESARAGVRLCYELGKLPEVVDLLRRFLAGDPAPEDEFWARWELVDHLAKLRRCKEAVDMQRDFLRWARGRFRPERFLTVMSDGTQALCWDEAGVGAEGLGTFGRSRGVDPPRANTGA